MANTFDWVEMRGIANCAHCAEYACDRLKGFFGFAPEAQAVLDEIRRSL